LFKVAKPCKEIEFIDFFDKNWKMRHYTPESGKTFDEIILKSRKNAKNFVESKH
jgi:hypothetical protein